MDLFMHPDEDVCKVVVYSQKVLCQKVDSVVECPPPDVVECPKLS